MKKHLLLLCVIFITLIEQTAAQKTGHGSYRGGFAGNEKSGNSTSGGSTVTTSGSSGTGANIDVTYHKCMWRINPDSATKYIRGWVQTNFTTITSGVTSLTFDLNNTHTVDSVRFRGAKLPAGNVTKSGGILTIVLGATLGNNVKDSIWIYYRGTPPAINAQAEGYQSNFTKKIPDNSPAGGNYIYTLAESYEDKDWWPCKADIQVKIDSMDIIISVPNSGLTNDFWAATNGKLVDSTISGSSRVFTFQVRKPIASYLVAVGVAKYKRFYRTPVNINGTLVPVVYNIFSGKSTGTENNILTQLDNSRLFLSQFSNKFGDYGFKNEKHGYYEFGWGGGMEHQSFSAMSEGSMQSWDVIAHELMHQWFGDEVTPATWNHLWLAEGFARYGEFLALELNPTISSTDTDSSYRRTVKNAALALSTTPIYIPPGNMENSNLIWNNATYANTVYDRGGMVVTMLRALVGDAIFYQACKNYIARSAFKSATTDSLKNNFNALLGGVDIAPFFTDFIYGTGNPIYNSITWNNYATNKLAVKIGAQTKSGSSSVGYFHTPIILRVQGAGGKDTTIVLYDMNGTVAKAGNGIGVAQSSASPVLYNLSFNPTSVRFDNKHQLLATGTTPTINVTLDLKVLDFSAKNSGSYNEVYLTLDDNSINSAIVLDRSQDGTSFSSAGNMVLQPAAGTVKHYYFKDANPYNGATYYRAKFKNTAGEYVYSKVVKVQLGRENNFTVVNNPVKGNLLIKTSVNNNAFYQFTIVDATGKLLSSEQKQVNAGTLQFDVHKLPAGAYLLKISTPDGDVSTLKFVVQ